MGKNTIVMSLSVPPELADRLTESASQRGHKNRSKLSVELLEDFKDLDVRTHVALRDAAQQRGVSVASLVEFLLDKFPLDDATIKPIVLRIPIDVIEDRAKLVSWLGHKSAILINHLHPQ